MNEPMRPVGVLQAGARAAHGIGHKLNGMVLADNALGDALLHVHQLLHLAFHHARHGYAGPLGDDFRHVLGIDLFFEHLVGFLQVRQALVFFIKLSLQLDDGAVADLGDFFEIAAALGLRLDCFWQPRSAPSGCGWSGWFPFHCSSAASFHRVRL